MSVNGESTDNDDVDMGTATMIAVLLLIENYDIL